MQPQSSGQTLSYDQTVNSASSFISGGAQTVALATGLEQGGAGFYNLALAPSTTAPGFVDLATVDGDDWVSQLQQHQQVGPSYTIRNADLAGQNHPLTGVPFNNNGFPDFSSVAVQTVQIQYTGTRLGDYAAANEAAGLDYTPDGFTWHHVEDGTTMQLVPEDIHAATGHTGGFSLFPQ